MLKRFLYSLLILFFVIVSPAFAVDYKISSVIGDNSENIILLNGNISTSDIRYSAGFLENPTRAYIDLEDAVLIENKKTITLKNGPISKVVMAQFSVNPNKVRLVFYSDSAFALKNIRLLKNEKALVFKLNDFKYADAQIPVIFSDILPKEYEEVKELPIEKAKYSSFVLTNIFDSNNGLLLSGIGNVKLSRPFILTDPIRIVFDMQNAVVLKKDFYGEYELANGDTIKIGQFTPNTLRFVVTTENPVLYKAFISPDMHSIFITNIEKTLRGVLPNTNVPANIKKIEIIKTSPNETFVALDFDSPVVHSLKKTYNKFVIDLLNVNYDQNQNIKNSVQTPQFDGFVTRPMAEGSTSLSLMFSVSDSLKVETGMLQDGKRIAIRLTGSLDESKVPEEIVSEQETKPEEKVKPKKEKVRLKLKNKVILVDAGHGGKDPGAIAGKMFEKEAALKMALMLKENLEKQGAKVIMSRENDTYVSLKDRVSISNFENADLFVSIHLNSSEKSNINGIETHWYTAHSKPLAEAVHNEMVTNIKANDRGLFKSMLYVINHTEAPAILVETGFISNNEERDELFKKDRQEATAKSIADGIVKYFEKR